MVVCPRCGEENPERARFCLACAAPLAAESGLLREERKTVSVLFVDLVGFTARSERADPEDVRATLRDYHARLKHEIERFGGTVEKFVGDAVMAVFGAPVAHEDDAERAVRAGLAVLEAVEELGGELAVRAAVNTGEAVVTLGARPELGEGFVTGDVVNTASRLQGAAPTGALVVGGATCRATGHAIDYEELEPVTVKGKAEPLPLYRAVGARSRFGVDLAPSEPGTFVGREDELALLRGTYARMLREQSVQLVTVSGEPGVGKSRLTAELRAYVDAQPEIVFWRQGRCLPYGEGITYWALGEIVKGHAGILESDGADEARAKLAAAVETVVEPRERDWLESRLAPLVGVAADGDRADREESFAAWRAFLEAVAARRPLVLVLEDLHWADAALLAFVEHLVDWATGVPLLVVCTARPELYELNPEWGGGKRNATTISLSALTPDETARLLHDLLDRVVIPADVQATLLERSGGNPLYAEEFVRMLRDRESGESEVAMPDTVQALIAARIDTLAPERKALLHDAAVVGKVFWTGAVAAVGGHEERDARGGLHELARKELVRPVRAGSVEGEQEHVFWHALVRDVAYGQIPRAARAHKHVATARWIEGIAGERLADHAELLAHHYVEALELARAAGDDALAAEAQPEAARLLKLAADRAEQLDLGRAIEYLEQAVALLPPGHPRRGRVLGRLAEMGDGIVSLEEQGRRRAEALADLRRAGDTLGVADVLAGVSMGLWIGGDSERSFALLDEAIEIAEQQPPSPELTRLYGTRAGRYAIAGRSAEAIDWAERALKLAERFDYHRIRVRALQMRGVARCNLADAGGIDDLREGLRLAQEHGLAQETTLGYTNLANWMWISEGWEAALPLYEEGIDLAGRRGLAGNLHWMRAESTWCLFDAGRWDEVVRVADEVDAWERERGEPGQPGLMAGCERALVLFYRGRVADAAGMLADLVPRARDVGDPQVLVPTLEAAMLVADSQGRAPDALALARERWERVPSIPPLYPDAARACARAGAHDLLRDFASSSVPWKRELLGVRTAEALLAESGGSADEAAALFLASAEAAAELGVVLEQGRSLADAGRHLIALGRLDEARGHLEAARSIFGSLGALPLVIETERTLERALPLSS